MLFPLEQGRDLYHPSHPGCLCLSEHITHDEAEEKEERRESGSSLSQT